jgi:hypothetical protein
MRRILVEPWGISKVFVSVVGGVGVCLFGSSADFPGGKIGALREFCFTAIQ